MMEPSDERRLPGDVRRSGRVRCEVQGEVTVDNQVHLRVILADRDGQAMGGGELRFPLDRIKVLRESLSVVLRQQVSAVEPDRFYTVEQKRQTDRRAHQPWTEVEENRLRGLVKRSLAPEAIAADLGRSIGAVAARLERLGLIEDQWTWGDRAPGDGDSA